MCHLGQINGDTKVLLELFIFYQLIVIALFVLSFFTKHEILWALTLISSAMLMMSGYTIEQPIYVHNATSGAYDTVVMTYSYPYLVGFNMVFLSLALILGLFDMFDKYQWNLPFRFKGRGN